MMFYKKLLQIVAILLVYKIVLILFTRDEVEYLLYACGVVLSLMYDPANFKKKIKEK